MTTHTIFENIHVHRIKDDSWYSEAKDKENEFASHLSSIGSLRLFCVELVAKRLFYVWTLFDLLGRCTNGEDGDEEESVDGVDSADETL